MLKQRVITASILAILFLIVLFVLPVAVWYVLVGLVVMQGAWEWTRLARISAQPRLLYVGTLIFSYVALLWMYGNFQLQHKSMLQLFVYGVSALFWLLLAPVFLKGWWKSQSPLILGVVGWIVLLPTAMAMLDLRFVNPQPWWLLGVMGMVWMADIAAYFTGKRFGKNKLAPNISPGKTWEGVAGALLGVMVYVVLIMLGSGMTKYYSLILFGVAGVALSVVGDLFESAMKRQAGVKDSGSLLPGHGGLLDRIDALTSTLPLAALVLILTRFP